MASIGPQLPPHLQKRKRTLEDDSPQTTPPTKAKRHVNYEEIPIDDSDSDESFGPAAPASGGTNTAPQIGPSLPSQPTSQDDYEDHSANQRPKTAPPPSKRVHGPAPPSQLLPQGTTVDRDSESDSDSDWGPSLPTNAQCPRGTSPSGLNPVTHTESESTALKRDDWMVAPPTQSGYRAPDPTKLKNRKFTSGRSASDKPSGGVSSIWTETPEEKARRLANAVLGREDPLAANTQDGQPSGARFSSGRRADKDKIQAFTEQTRGRSLVEEHQAARKVGGPPGTSRKEDDEDDPSKRAFDWEKDMKVGGQVTNSQRRQLLARAANFGGRFQKGNYL